MRLEDCDVPTGAELLDDVERFVRRFCALPSEAAFVAVTLWAAHAHAPQTAESSPRLAFLSPEPASGKTRALEVLDVLVPHPMHAVNATPAALYRAVADLDHRPTLLFDEIDTVFGPKAKDNEELRGLLNAGHRRSGVAYRCVGEGTNQKVHAFPAYAPLALAGLGDLPDTVMSRSVLVRMRRRAPHESVEPFRLRWAEPEGHTLRDRLAGWTAQVHDALKATIPTIPERVTDRPADVWEPLLAIAEHAGGHWPERARAACLELVTAGQDREPSLRLRLLADLREVFGDRERMSTEAILSALRELEDAPWSDLRGKPLDARGLSKMLREYEVTPVKMKVDGTGARGYRREDLHDPWSRYLPPSAASPEPTEPTEPEDHHPSATGVPPGSGSAQSSGPVPEPEPLAALNPVTGVPEPAPATEPNPEPLPTPDAQEKHDAGSAGSAGSGLAAEGGEPASQASQDSPTSPTSTRSPRRVQVVKGRVPEGAVYVGRAVSRLGLTASRYGNPHRVGNGVDHDEAVRRYERQSVPTFDLAQLRADLAGQDLACWCAADQTCHADVLLRLANTAPENVDTCCGKRAPAGGPLVNACQLCPDSPTYHGRDAG